ncbi:allantoate permease [Zalerion maritima]|uniref:Allantoate permease n=1 Tax=Zalerion maritima TaxID=339359 RepID=A0AAD5WVI3_9PEZI|nr:allantoate permease [Zalerion maritima]
MPEADGTRKSDGAGAPEVRVSTPPAITADPTEKRDINEVERTATLEDGYLDEKDKQPDYSRMDKEVGKYASDKRVEISEEKSNELRRLIDRRVLVVMVCTYFLQAIDKGTMSFASIMGIVDDTGLVGQQYSWLTSCIYIAILIVEYPQNYIISRVPIGKYLSFMIIGWGTVLACHAACKNFTGLVVVRTLLGIFESACQPAFLVLGAMWYRREEQASRVTYWYMMNGGQQIVGGLLAYCFTLIKTGPLKNWQWLFLTYGIISVFFGFFVLWWLPDSPMRAKCFTEEQKHLMVERVRDNQTGLQNKKWKKEHVVDAFKDPQTYGYAMIALCTTLPTSGLGAFANIIIKNFGFTTLQTQLLAMVLGVVIIIVLLSSVWMANKWNQNLIVMAAWVIPSYVGTILLMTLPDDTKAQSIGLLICYYMTLSFWSAATLNLTMISRNVGGQTKKGVVIAVHFVCWSAGNTIGPQVFLSNDGPRYFTAFATHIGCYTALVLTIGALRWYLASENKRRDAMAEAGVREARDEKMIHAFDDLTDRENPNFRYVF